MRHIRRCISARFPRYFAERVIAAVLRNLHRVKDRLFSLLRFFTTCINGLVRLLLVRGGKCNEAQNSSRAWELRESSKNVTN